MEKYQDGYIIKKRREREKELSTSIRQGMYVGNRQICFKPRVLDEEGLKMYLPDYMEPISDEIKRLKYPMEKRPSVIWSNSEASETFSFNLLSQYVMESELEQIRDRLGMTILSIHPHYMFRDKGKIQHDKGDCFWVEYLSPVIGGMMYNILYTASLKDKLLMGMFHCGADEKEDWKPIVLQLISTIRWEEKVLFCGLVQEIHLFMEGAVYTVTLEAISYTSILDQTKRFRTFQNINQTYRELVKEVLSSYTNASVIFPVSDKELGDMQVQYQETDWEFLKRMASQLGTGLVADEHLEKAAFYFGLKNGQDEMEISVEACAVRDCVAGREKYREYEFVTPELLEIGDKRIYRRMRMQVWAAQIRLINEELKCISQLRSPSKCRKAQYDNLELIGVSVKGIVREVHGEKVRIAIEGDLGKETEKRWFDYATVYSSPDGSAWYFMPEIGDEIRLYFPDEKAGHSYILNALHVESENQRNNPDRKFIRTKRNQEIRFTPGQIMITNHCGMSVILDDENGIEIKSNKGIVLEAGETIEINCGGVVAVKGKSAVILKQGNNMIAVRNGIREQGLRIERQ